MKGSTTTTTTYCLSCLGSVNQPLNVHEGSRNREGFRHDIAVVYAGDLASVCACVFAVHVAHVNAP